MTTNLISNITLVGDWTVTLLYIELVASIVCAPIFTYNLWRTFEDPPPIYKPTFTEVILITWALALLALIWPVTIALVVLTPKYPGGKENPLKANFEENPG